MTEAPDILLVHGAWHSSACWDKVKPILQARGRQVHTVDLPSVHAANPGTQGMYDDARAVKDAIEAIAKPVVVVAHSYGGIPVAEGSTGLPNVEHLVFIAAFTIGNGESLLDALGSSLPSWLAVQGDLAMAGTADEPAEQVFYEDLPADEAAERVAALKPHSARAFSEPLTTASWGAVPSTYVVTGQDRAVPTPVQEMLAKRIGATIVGMDTDHSPFLSRPEDIADIIAAAKSGEH